MSHTYYEAPHQVGVEERMLIERAGNAGLLHFHWIPSLLCLHCDNGVLWGYIPPLL